MDRLVDFFNLVWALSYWNLRKTVYRWRGRSGPCPCHHPSDSGRAGETACQAVQSWREPARFRRVCPLLQRTSAGVWRCSVDRSGVRPFWGRAAAYYGAGGLALYLVLTLAAFLALRGIGYGVSYAGVVWPPAWSKFDAVRADFFLEKSRRAYAAGEINEALLSLSLAHQLDPSRYELGRLAAQGWQIGQPGLADSLYQQLLASHPERAEETAQAWLPALLLRGDFHAIQGLAGSRLASASPASPAWLHAFFVATRRLPASEALARLRAEPALVPAARAVLDLASDLAALPSAAARERLLQAPPPGADAYYFFFVARRLIELGHADDALALLDPANSPLVPRDRLALRLDALHALGWTSTLHADVDSLLTAAPGAPLLELLAAHLIRHPDPALLAAVFDRVQATPPPLSADTYPAYLALYCAAGAHRDAARLGWTAERLKTFVKSDFAALDGLGDWLLGRNARGTLDTHLPFLQALPLETAYALFERFAPPAPAR